MLSTQEALFELLHIAFGEQSTSSFEGVDWSMVLNLASEQGVVAIAFDGVQKIPKQYLPAMDTLMDWLGQSSYHEAIYDEQLAAATYLAEKYHQAGLRTFVLKGFSVGMLYPEPKHRPCGDMDCYLMYDAYQEDSNNANAVNAFEKGNIVAEELGVEVDRSYYIHSKFNYMKMTVENHHHLMAIKGSKNDKLFEKKLLSLMDIREQRFIHNTWMETPSPLFQAVYILSHAREHFLNEKITLRHVCDWAMILKAYTDDVDWIEWKTICQEYGLLKFGYAMSRIAEKCCGVTLPFNCDVNKATEDALQNDIIFPKCYIDGRSRFARHLQIIRNIFTSSWKFRLYSQSSSSAYIWKRVRGYFFEKV